jgi:hypothetical protein
MKRFLAALYRGWMAFAHFLGRVQTYLLLSIIYFVAVGLTAPFIRIFMRDPLDRRMGDRDSVWTPKEHSNLKLDEAQRLF